VLRIGDVIQSIGTVAMVLDPWDKPLCLERVWCLYEIAQTLGDSDVNMEVEALATPTAAVATARAVSGNYARAFADRTIAVARTSSGTDSRSFADRTTAVRVKHLEPAVPRQRAKRTGGSELAQALLRTKLCLTMAPTERLRLVHAARTIPRAQIERALTRFDCRTAGASVEADRQMILAFIAAKFATPLSRDISSKAGHSASSKAAVAEERAYESFNRRVQLAIREAVASFSHLNSY
jgi:hypothetical protein